MSLVCWKSMGPICVSENRNKCEKSEPGNLLLLTSLHHVFLLLWKYAVFFLQGRPCSLEPVCYFKTVLWVWQASIQRVFFICTCYSLFNSPVSSDHQISFQTKSTTAAAAAEHPSISLGFVRPSVKLLPSHSVSGAGTSSLCLAAAGASIESAELQPVSSCLGGGDWRWTLIGFRVSTARLPAADTLIQTI